MEISVAQPARFKKIFEVLKELYADLEVEFTSTNFGFLLEDKTGTAFVHLNVLNRPENFPTYVCPQPVKICVSMENFCKLMHPLNNEHTLELRIPPEQAAQPTQLFVEMQDVSQGAGPKRKVAIRLSTAQEEQGHIDGFTFDRTVQIESQKLRNFCNDIAWVNDKIMVSISINEITLRCKGEDTADYSLTIPCVLMPDKNRVVLDNNKGAAEPLALPPSNLAATGVETKGIVSGIFSLKYMKNFLKAQDLATNVLLSLAIDGPMLLRFEMNDYGVLEFFLAPIQIEDSPFSDTKAATNAMDETLLI